MAKLGTYRDVIDLWTSRKLMALDIAVPDHLVLKWWQRNSIPPAWWHSIVNSGVGRAAGVTPELLMSFARRNAFDREKRAKACA